jgi:hypothetical protein
MQPYHRTWNSDSNGLAQIFFYFRHSRRIRELPQGQRIRELPQGQTATTASLPVTVTACKHPRKFSAPVGVVSKLKKKNEFGYQLPWFHSPLCAGPPDDNSCFYHWMCANTFTVIYSRSFSPWLSFLQASHSGISSSSSVSSQHYDFLTTSASDFNIGRMMSTIHHLKAWQKMMKPRIDEAMVWQKKIGQHRGQYC